MTTATTAKIKHDIDATLEPYEIKALLRAPDRRTWKGKRAAALLAVLSYGLRIGEACTLRVSQVTPDKGGCVALDKVKTLKRKDGYPRTLVLDATASRLVKDWIAASGSKLYLFPGRRDHLSVDAARAIVVPYLHKERPETTPHNLRHSFCTNLVRETGDIWLASELAGHSDIRITALRYAHASRKDARRAASALAEALARRKNAAPAA